MSWAWATVKFLAQRLKTSLRSCRDDCSQQRSPSTFKWLLFLWTLSVFPRNPKVLLTGIVLVVSLQRLFLSDEEEIVLSTGFLLSVDGRELCFWIDPSGVGVQSWWWKYCSDILQLRARDEGGCSVTGEDPGESLHHDLSSRMHQGRETLPDKEK